MAPLARRMKAYDFSVLWRTFGVFLAYPWRTRRTLGVLGVLLAYNIYFHTPSYANQCDQAFRCGHPANLSVAG